MICHHHSYHSSYVAFLLKRKNLFFLSLSAFFFLSGFHRVNAKIDTLYHVYSLSILFSEICSHDVHHSTSVNCAPEFRQYLNIEIILVWEKDDDHPITLSFIYRNIMNG